MATIRFFHVGVFDRTGIRRDFHAKLPREAKRHSTSADGLIRLLGFLEHDARITDVRWMAYMLATALWETGHRMTPVDEGAGSINGTSYYQPVKVHPTPNGSALVTESDGDQWKVDPSGHLHPLHEGAKPGTRAASVPVKAFSEAPGKAIQYHGRGYVQLTHWSNYAVNGAMIGRGLRLLFDPTLVLDPAVSYEVMASGMITGVGFANNHKLSTYFHGANTDYLHARAIINAGELDPKYKQRMQKRHKKWVDGPKIIAAIAQTFEGMLLENKIRGGWSAGHDIA